MKFISTRRGASPVSFTEAVQMGLAPDGGLFVPEVFPIFSPNDFADLTYPQMASLILQPFLQENFDSQKIISIAEKAFSFPVTLKALTPETSILELFHGPTAAFKDVAAQFLGVLMSLLNHGEKTILVATSGDTGGAVAAAFDGRPGFRVIILFPKDGVSPLQKQQLTCWGSNIFSLAVDGSFDDCQRIVKSLLAQSAHASRFHLTSANSINIARLLPQTTYYAASSIWWWRERQQKARFVIPTGNMGNAVAAFWAQRMGFPIERIVMATNANHVVSDYFRTGKFQPHASIPTLANAMDVGNPSNFERLKGLYPEWESLRTMSACYSVSDDQIRSTIEAAYKNHGEILCPHSATAMAVRESLEGDWIVVATAHPAKFTEIVKPIVKQNIPLSECLRTLHDRGSRWVEIPPEEAEVLRVLRE